MKPLPARLFSPSRLFVLPSRSIGLNPVSIASIDAPIPTQENTAKFGCVAQGRRSQIPKAYGINTKPCSAPSFIPFPFGSLCRASGERAFFLLAGLIGKKNDQTMLQLVTHRPNQQQPHFSFFILNKGMNSGKPLTAPCANCFVAICSNENEKEMYYWLCWGLWQAKAFDLFLTGSVIVFIRKKELQDLLQKHAARINPEAYTATVAKVQAMAQHEEKLLQQLQLMKQLKRAMIRAHLR